MLAIDDKRLLSNSSACALEQLISQACRQKLTPRDASRSALLMREHYELGDFNLTAAQHERAKSFRKYVEMYELPPLLLHPSGRASCVVKHAAFCELGDSDP